MSRAEFGLVPAQMAGRMGGPIDAEIEREWARIDPLWPNGVDAVAARAAIRRVAASRETTDQGMRFQLLMIVALAAAGIAAIDCHARATPEPPPMPPVSPEKRALLEALEADRWLDCAAALDRENRALRERCERLRQAAIFADGLRQQDQTLDRALAACEARGDLDPLEAEHADAG